MSADHDPLCPVLDLSMFVFSEATEDGCNEGFDCPVRGHFHA